MSVMLWKKVLFCLLLILGCGLLQEHRPAAEQDRLVYYSLRLIASQEQLRGFFALEYGEREDWLRRFWKDLDPTPTTAHNERRCEHDRRVAYALEHYSTQFWGRPWDDRGDAYIKFGEPDERDVAMEGAILSETWYYSGSRLSLKFAENALEDGYRWVPVPKNVIRTKQDLLVERAIAEAEVASKEPVYDYGLDTSLLYYCHWSRFKGEQDSARVELLYAVPGTELDFSDGWGRVGLRVKVHDDKTYEEVASRVAEQRFPEAMVERNGLLIGSLDFSVPPGSYRLGVRVEDLKTKRMGILKSGFSACDFSRLSVSDLNLESPVEVLPKRGPRVEGEPPLKRVFRRSQKVVLRYEIYNLVRSPVGRTWYETEYLIRAHRRGVGDVSSTFQGKGDSSQVRHRLRLDLSASPLGDYEIVLTLRDMIGKRQASASVGVSLVD